MNKFISLLLCLIVHVRLSSEGLGLGTQVITSTGPKKIETLTLDDSIACYDCVSHKLVTQNVTWLHQTRVEGYIRMVVGDDVVEMARDQRLYIPSAKQWACIETILKDQDLLKALCTDYDIQEIAEVPETKDLYTLTVKPHHNFFITEHHILVHNIAPRRSQKKPHNSPRHPTGSGKKDHHTTHTSHNKQHSDHTPPHQKNTLPSQSQHKKDSTHQTNKDKTTGKKDSEKKTSAKDTTSETKKIRNPNKKKAAEERKAARKINDHIPKDADTILKNTLFKRTNFTYQKAAIFKKGNRYYYRDQKHKSNPHLEVFNERGEHLGEADIHTEEIKPGTADPSKNLKNR